MLASMCGRFSYAKEFRDIKIRFDLEQELPLFRPRYNIAPGQEVAVIAREGERAVLKTMRWGLVPSWAADPAIGNRMINARAETLAERPSFKDLVRNRRCLVLSDGFYEWRREGKRKTPIRFVLKSGEPFVFAGLWDRWRKPDGGALESFTIITTEPNELLKSVHDRMPVILLPEDEQRWLGAENRVGAPFPSLLEPFPSGRMEGYAVSLLVNSPENDLPACIEEQK